MGIDEFEKRLCDVPLPATYIEIKRKTGISLPTIGKYIPLLEKENRIVIRKFGNAKAVMELRKNGELK